jgi:hypothetical protein
LFRPKEAIVADYATLLRDHVTLTCRSVDRIFLQAYVPKPQCVGGVCQFLYWQKGFSIPSSAAFGKIGDAYVAEVYRWAKAHGVPVRRFAKGENKEEIARPLIEAAEREGGDGKVVLIGIAQEKTPLWRSWKAKGQEHAAHPHMEWGRQMGFVNHFYFYLWDPEWGGAFWKTNAYAPWPVWIWLNGHTWAQRQCDRLGIGYTALELGGARDALEFVTEGGGFIGRQLDDQSSASFKWYPHHDAAPLLGCFQRTVSGPGLHRRHRVLPPGSSWPARADLVGTEHAPPANFKPCPASN